MLEATEVGTTHLGVPGPPGMPWWVVLPSEPHSGTSSAHLVSSGPEKIHKKFRYVWTQFGIDFPPLEKSSRKEILALGTMLIG